MMRLRRRAWIAGALAAAALTAVALTIPAEGATPKPTTGVGSCPLKNWNPSKDPKDAKDLPLGHRPMTYTPDGFDCSGDVFAKPGVEFAKFPQPRDFHVTNKPTTRMVNVCTAGTCAKQAATTWSPAATVNPLAPYFP